MPGSKNVIISVYPTAFNTLIRTYVYTPYEERIEHMRAHTNTQASTSI